MSPDQIVALVLALTGPPATDPLFPVIAAGGADPRYPVHAAACPRPLAPFEIEGKTVACGSVDVPEDHDHPEGRRLALSFMIFKSRSLVPAPDAVVHLHGGPGSGIVERVALTSTMFDQIRARRDVVAFDQRGVDTSAGAQSRCWDTLASDPKGLAEAAKGAAVPGLQDRLTRACLAEIAASGADIAQINTAQNARDVAAVMQTLGYPTYNAYGISYGTKLAQEVMRITPEGLRAVVLDSVAPVQEPIYDTLALPHAEAIQNIFDACSADPRCAAAYPDLRARFWALMARLETAPVASPAGPVTPDVLFTLVDGRNDYKAQLQGLTGYVPQIVAELERGETKTLMAVQEGHIALHPTAESALAGLTGREDEATALARAALRIAQMQTLSDANLTEALTALEAARRAEEMHTGPVEAFEAALSAAAQALPEAQAKVAFGAAYLRLRKGDATLPPILALIGTHFPAPEAARLRALAEGLDPAQLAQVFARIGADNRALDRVLLSGFQTQMFACQEDMDINSPAGAAAVSARLQREFGWPASLTAAFEAIVTEGFYKPCAAFTPHPRKGFHDPVTAAIPTLVLQGTMDTQTAPSWGAEMVASLPKGRLVVLPESGHGTLAFSQCARDLGVAFLEDPNAPLDTRCAASLAPAFLLPDGSFSK